jgi:hypothetical protein
VLALVLSAALGIVTPACAVAGGAGLIVVGLTGNETDSETQTRLAAETRTALIRRGLPAEHVTVLATGGRDPVTRERVLAALRHQAGRLGPEDEFWLVLFGHSGRAAGGGPAFQISGPRLTAEDLQSVLPAIPARKYVFIGTGNSGAYLPFLADSNTTALAATSEGGEVNQPRFPEHWVKAFAEDPRAPLAVIGARAARRVEQAYTGLGLLQGEHARLADPVSSRILEPPFGIADLAAPAAEASAPAPVRTGDIDLSVPRAGLDEQVVPPTAETKDLLAAARGAPNPGRYPALFLLTDTRYTVNSDRSTTETTLLRVYLASEEAVRTWADFTLTSFAPASVTEVLGARTILPDGTARVLNAAAGGPASLAEGLGGESSQTLRFPGACAGCIVEISYRTEKRPDNAIPEFFDELPIQRSLPILQADLTLKLPKEEAIRFRLRNAEQEPVRSTTGHSTTLAWTFTHVPAFEPLPLDPPPRDLVIALTLSSLKSWDEFTAWYRRIARGSEESDPTVRDKARELAAGSTNTMDRIRAAFEYVSSLRYVAIELGVHAFRPRTPAKVLANRYGDCKDKANLLVALLREMGLPAQFVLISRMSSADPDFPGWYFNHAIAHVPCDEARGVPEDLWLDTTDTATPFGFVAPGNLGRNALVFDGEKAAFKVVTSPRASRTDITETWTLTQTDSNRWAGTAELRWTGLADYERRLTWSPLSPQRRSLALHEALDARGPGAEYDDLKLSDLADLSSPVTLTCAVRSPAPLPIAAGLDFIGCLAAPTRNRPIEINDGQPLRYRQTVRLIRAAARAAPQPPEAFRRETTGLMVEVAARRVDDRTWERVASCELRTPRLDGAAYPALRRALREWTRALQESWPVEPPSPPVVQNP